MARLYRKWKVFADNYLRLNMNGTRAYKATYGDQLSDDVCRAAAPRLLAKVSIQDYITQQMEANAMGAEEVLHRYAQQARAEYANYATPYGVDIQRLINDGKAHLIKKWSYNQYGKPMLEFYDAQHALDQIGKHLKLFADEGQVINLHIEGLDDLIEKIYGNRSSDDHPGG